jgi:hypothetical protein
MQYNWNRFYGMPQFFSYHDCNDGPRPCQKRVDIMIPKDFVSHHREPDKTYKLGVINLEGNFDGQLRDCIDWVVFEKRKIVKRKCCFRSFLPTNIVLLIVFGLFCAGFMMFYNFVCVCFASMLQTIIFTWIKFGLQCFSCLFLALKAKNNSNKGICNTVNAL